MKIEEKIQEVLNKVRPMLKNDGGDVEFVKFEDGIVYVSMIGACSGCPMAAITLNEGIKSVLVEEIPEVTNVINTNE